VRGEWGCRLVFGSWRQALPRGEGKVLLFGIMRVHFNDGMHGVGDFGSGLESDT